MGGGCKKQKCFWVELQEVDLLGRRVQEIEVLLGGAARSRSAYGGGCKKQRHLWEELQEEQVLLGGKARSRNAFGRR
jgi:hypothetical protein